MATASFSSIPPDGPDATDDAAETDEEEEDEDEEALRFTPAVARGRGAMGGGALVAATVAVPVAV